MGFEVLDAVGGAFARLARRSPTLDGAVPVRVAQACVPLLEGNAFGWQIELTRRLTLRRALGRWHVHLADRDRAELARAHAAALPRLLAQGFVARGGHWHRALERAGGGAMAWHEGAVAGLTGGRLCLWTGLLVRPVNGAWLRVANAGNRRNVLIDVAETLVPGEGDGALVPLVLELTVRARDADEVRLEGEVACVAPVRPGARVGACELDAAPEVGRAHVAFYDAEYFATKRGEVTRKYRRLVGGSAAEESTEKSAEESTEEPAECRVVCAGPAAFEFGSGARVATAAGVRAPAPGQPAGVAQVTFRAERAFTATYDGHTLALGYDAVELAEAGRALEQRWARVYGADFVAQHKGALWYLTKYFTPHPPGEPHFFVKPWAFVVTPPGWSSLLEGHHGEGYDVMRGVVATDRFHATPAVFHVRRVGAMVRIAEGTALLTVVPVPRELLRAGYRAVGWRDEG